MVCFFFFLAGENNILRGGLKKILDFYLTLFLLMELETLNGSLGKREVFKLTLMYDNYGSQ